MKTPGKTKRIMGRTCYAIIVLYVAVYIILSVNGHYSTDLYITGRLRDVYGMGIPDAHIWEPKFTKLTPNGYNLVGGCYCFALWADRKFWHTRVMLSPSDKIEYPQGTYMDSGLK